MWPSLCGYGDIAYVMSGHALEAMMMLFDQGQSFLEHDDGYSRVSIVQSSTGENPDDMCQWALYEYNFKLMMVSYVYICRAYDVYYDDP